MVLERLSMQGRRAVITGAGRGLGRAMALSLADAGADIVCAARTQSELDETAQAVRDRGRDALTVVTDVTRSSQVDGLVQQSLAAWGSIDVFIANAGANTVADTRDPAELTDEEWAESVTLNFSSAFYSARAIIPHFRERGGGNLITVSSRTALRATPEAFTYGAAKAGIVALTQSLAERLAPENIRVNCIVPGPYLRETLHDAAEIDTARARGRALPAGRFGEAWEIGPLALYLASDASSYMTGEAFVADGGRLASGAVPLGWDVTSGAIVSD